MMLEPAGLRLVVVLTSRTVAQNKPAEHLLARIGGEQIALTDDGARSRLDCR
jgi:hypothetical protein